MECPLCLEWMENDEPRCVICGHDFGPSVQTASAVSTARASVGPFTFRRAEAELSAADLPGPIPFTGRDRDLRLLRSFLEEPIPPQGRVVVLQGDAGTGKTRLVEKALREMVSPPETVLWKTEPFGGAVIYGPVLTWLQSLLEVGAGASPSDIRRRMNRLLTEVEGLETSDGQYLLAALGILDKPNQAVHLPCENITRNLYRALGRVLASRAGEGQNLCLIVDQAQWTDVATGRFLDEALNGFIGVDLTILCLTRDANRGWHPACAPGLSLELEPFTAEERKRLFDAVVPVLEFLPELRQQYIQEGTGTPLFLEELGRLVQQVMEENAGPLNPEDVANIIEIVPLSQEELIGRRIDLLDERTRWLLDVAALLGPDCSLGLLECFDEIREDLADQLRALEGMRFLERREDGSGNDFQFKDVGLREIVYGRLLADQRKALHQTVAETIEKAFADRLPEKYEILAYHYEKAGQAEKAAYYQIRAADHRVRLGESQAAVDIYQKATELIERLPASEENQTRMARILIRQGHLLRLLGRTGEAVACLDTARGLAENLGNEFLAIQARLERVIFTCWGKNGDAEEELERLAERISETGQAAAECLLLNARGVLNLHAGRFEPALVAFRELAEKARILGKQQFEADALNNTGLIYWRWSRYAEAAKCFRAASSLRMRMGDKFGQVAALLNLGIIQEQLAEIRPAFRNYRTALGYARETAFVQGQAVLEINLSNLERRSGFAASAMERAARALELAQRIEDHTAEIIAMENLGLAYGAVGRVEEGAELLEQALVLAEKAGAGEQQVQIGLDLLDVRSAGWAATAADVSAPSAISRQESAIFDRQATGLLARVEEEQFPDLLAKACRLKGRALFLGQESNRSSASKYLLRALDHAIQSQNIFEELDSLREIIGWSFLVENLETERMEGWSNRLDRISRMLRVQELV